MELIRDIIARDLTHTIQEIIKVNQNDESTVYEEITEYVATDSIKENYTTILNAIAKSQTSQDESYAVWISGFFGSGKSSFAKNLGYIISNPIIQGQSASELFKKQIHDKKISDYIDLINLKIPAEVIMFDVSADKAVKKSTERLTEIIYSVFLRELGYAQDFDIAALEIELESENRLDKFINIFNETFPDTNWEKARSGAERIVRASAILHKMDPSIFSDKRAWMDSIKDKREDITVNILVPRIFDLMERRKPNKALVFIIDEVGQYIARSGEKIEDLRAIVEQMGRESKRRMKLKKAIAPAWIIVTSQEKLHEIVAAIDNRSVELARLQDRFKYRVDLAPSDIREVATKRVLAKKPEAIPILTKLYQSNEGRLSAQCKLERTTRLSNINQEDFIQYYPYLPQFIDLSIDIMSGIRIQPGATRHLGGSNRTIIKQAYEMLVSDRTKMANQPIGRLVTLDLIYELVENNLPSEKVGDINEVMRRFPKASEDKGWSARVVKAICLLEFVRDLPRSDKNIAAMLVDNVGQQAPLKEVQDAVKRLDPEFIKSTEEGYKLQTREEKLWEEKRQKYLEPRPVQKNAIKQNILGEIFSDTRLKQFRYKDLKTFKIGINVDDVLVGDVGAINILISTTDTEKEFQQKISERRDLSRQTTHQNDLYWVMKVDSDTENLINKYFASQQLINEYDILSSQNKITPMERDCLTNEKRESSLIKNQLQTNLSQCLIAGIGLFRGVHRDGSSLGKTISEVFSGLLNTIIPDLFPKLSIGARKLKGDEQEIILNAANLQGLPSIFYEGEKGLGLVKKDGSRYVPNINTQIAKDYLDMLKKESDYGTRVTGKIIESHFLGFGYGWDTDMSRLVLALLFRAGAIEVTYQGKRYVDYQDVDSRMAFSTVPAFRSSSFAPKKIIDLKILRSATDNLEAITGKDVPLEEGPICSTLKQLAYDEMPKVKEYEAIAKANKLPVCRFFKEYADILKDIGSSDSEACVSMLAGEGKSIKEIRDKVQSLQHALNDSSIDIFQKGHQTINHILPRLKEFEIGDLSESQTLIKLLNSEDFTEHLDEINDLSNKIFEIYKIEYDKLHKERSDKFSNAIEYVMNIPEMAQLSADKQKAIISDLTSRECYNPSISIEKLDCINCHSSPGQMKSEIYNIDGIKTAVIRRVHEASIPPSKIKNVKLSDFFQSKLEDEESINKSIEELRDHLLKLVAEDYTVIPE